MRSVRTLKQSLLAPKCCCDYDGNKTMLPQGPPLARASRGKRCRASPLALLGSHGGQKVFPTAATNPSLPYAEQRVQLRVSANLLRSFPSVETGDAALRLPPASSPLVSFFSGPDVDKLAASFLWALWRAKGYTLESLKPCHFHLEPVADLARQPGK